MVEAEPDMQAALNALAVPAAAAAGGAAATVRGRQVAARLQLARATADAVYGR